MTSVLLSAAASSSVVSTMGWQNVVDGDGIGISIVGIVIVFGGLALISVCIATVPKVLALLEPKTSKPAHGQKAAPIAPENLELKAAVVALAYHLEQQAHDPTDDQRITIVRNENQSSIWSTTGMMRTFQSRSK